MTGWLPLPVDEEEAGWGRALPTDPAVQLEYDAVGEGLAVRLTLHERFDLVPWPGPVEPEGDLPRRGTGSVPDGPGDLLESFGVMGCDLVDATVEIGEPVLVCREHLVGPEVAHLGE